MEKFDVVVVGAGPSGSTAAKRCAELGLSVICLDKATFPRIKACGGGLPQSIIDEFPLLRDYTESFTNSVEIIGSDMKSRVFYDKTEIGGAMVIREKFDHQLLKDAKKAGVNLIEGERVEDVTIKGNQIKVTTSKGNEFQLEFANFI